MQTLQGNLNRQPGGSYRSWNTVLFVAGVGFMSMVAWLMTPYKILTPDNAPILIVGLIFMLMLVIGLGSVVLRQQSIPQTIYRLGLVIWWFLLVCEVVFDRQGESVQSSQGNFSSQAYGEGVMWLLAFGAIVVLSIKYRDYIPQLFSPYAKWATLLAMVCAASFVLSPGKLYSLAWAFKLVLVVLLLAMTASVMDKTMDVINLMKATLWAFLILAVIPTSIALMDPASAFEGVGGRLNAGPDAMTLTAATLMLMSVILFTIEKKKIYVFTGIVGQVIMILCLGKTGNLAGFFSVMLYLGLQRKLVRGLWLMLGAAGIGFVILSVTPLADHLTSYSGASTLTGRTAIWAAGVQGFKESPIWGHGYLASYFSFEKESELLNGAVNLHNGFLEVAYNNGIIGLFLMVMIHIVMIRGIFRCMRTAGALRTQFPGDLEIHRVYLLSVGSLALYANLFINGLLNTAFGGRPMNSYMQFLALFFTVEMLQRYTTKLARSANGTHDEEKYDPDWEPMAPLSR